MPDALCKDIDGRARGGGHALSGLTVLVAAAACVLSLAPASAQAPERIRETCRELTRPQIQSCMQERKGAGDREKNREACRKAAEGAMRACMEQAGRGATAAENPAPAPAQTEPARGGDAARPRPAALVAPPRSVADIAAILDREKPDPAKRAQREADAAATPAPGLAGSALSEFYFTRCRALGDLGRLAEAIADCEKAIAIGGDYVSHISRVEQALEGYLRSVGENRRAADLLQGMAARLDAPGSKGRLFSIDLRLAINHIQLGDLGRAEGFVKRNRARIAEIAGRPGSGKFRSSWEASVEEGNARIHEARGRYREAELAYLRSAELTRDAEARARSWPDAPPRSNFQRAYDFSIAQAGLAKMAQGRLVEAEVDVRTALLGRLQEVGKYNQDTAQLVLMLSRVLSEQARKQEAESLTRAAIHILEEIGFGPDSPPMVKAENRLAAALFSEGRYEEAAAVFEKIDAAIAGWEAKHSARFRLGWARIFTAYYTGKVTQGIDLARELAKRHTARVGAKHFDTAMARAVLASGLAIAGRDGEALAEFKAAVPVLLTEAHDSDDDDDANAKQAADQRLQNIVETYLGLIARSPESAVAGIDTLQLGEVLRGQSVQNALAASAARAVARNPAMADLVRRDQDLEKQIAAQAGALGIMLGLAPEEREESELRALQGELDRLRAERKAARQEIERRFPEYDDLIAPKPATAASIQAALRPDEAFLALYLGRRTSFAWAVPKTGKPAFAAIAASRRSITRRIRRLREALAPNASTLEEIPRFDLALAHELYRLLLAPVEAGWRPARSIVVASNGALGSIPLSLLPVEPAATAGSASEPVFAEYRKVAWLARSHAVSTVPSAASLVTLRRMPVRSGKRDSLIGFGDPLFSPEQAAQAAPAPMRTGEVTTRGVGIRLRAAPGTGGAGSATLAMLPRLPDTAEELAAMALALQADPAKVLHLGRSANERAVKSAALARYRIVAFATHGLVPGDLDGLTQPALALSAPDVADVDGDGLLTMDEVLSLELDADWVVLSACNTGAGSGEGAEAATGLGRAFFYAGTRALLLTNWSVHTESARALVSDIFRRQSADPRLTRAEALRQAMIALMEEGAFADASGKVLFSYAHPLFWAPYSIIGDGGREN